MPALHRGGRQGYGNDLSPRQREVAELAVAGHTNNEIAERLFVSVHTVEKHISAAMQKLDVPNRHHLHRVLDNTPEP